jgi:2-oxoglutarate ferredoxin oxidoreductase subunit beta
MSTRETKREAIYTDYIAPFSEIEIQYDEGTSVEVDLHEGGKVVLYKADDSFSPLDRGQSIKGIKDASDKGELLTGLLYINESQPDFTETENTVIKPLNQIAFEDLCPGSKALHKLLDGYK